MSQNPPDGGYQFITKKEIEDIEEMHVGDDYAEKAFDLAYALLAERDAYREVAAKEIEHGGRLQPGETRDEFFDRLAKEKQGFVDAAARRILESSGRKILW